MSINFPFVKTSPLDFKVGMVTKFGMEMSNIKFSFMKRQPDKNKNKYYPSHEPREAGDS